MVISVPQIMALIGEKEVELRLARQTITELRAEIETLKKPKEPKKAEEVV